MVVRGNFRPTTVVTIDTFKSSFAQFQKEAKSTDENSRLLAEIPYEYLVKDDEVDEKDFLDRTELLAAMGYKVVISDCPNHQGLIDYLADHKVQKLGLVIGSPEIEEIFQKKYEENKNGRLLVAFGELFTQNIRVYVYPAKMSKKDKLLTLDTIDIPEGIKFLFYHLKEQKQIVSVEGFDEKILEIMPGNIFESIGTEGDDSWEKALPDNLVKVVKEMECFGYKSADNNTKRPKVSSNDASYY